ncbi:MAG: efflux RND transporter permease subunit [Thalassobaculales bacterium]
MKNFNLSTWALQHQTLVIFFMLAALVAGTTAYLRLGRAEDPDFTIKTMVITAQWPGATAREMELQVTDKIEKKLQELPYYDQTTSYSKPGEAVLKLNLRQDTPKQAVPEIWYQARKKLGDIRATLPEGVVGPQFNDEFGDTFGVIYALSGDGFSDLELKRLAEDIRQRLLSVRYVNKVDLVGNQDTKVFVEFSHARIAQLGVNLSQLFDALARQNRMAAAGTIEAGSERVALRLDNRLDTLQSIRDLPVVVGGRTFRVGDVAEVSAGTTDPKAFTMRVNGRQVLGLAVAMAKDGNILEMGAALDAAMARIQAELPVGLSVVKIVDQPTVVSNSINEFFKVLAEALGIVLVVSFLSLGLRTGVVVALSVPLVLAITFVTMEVMGINFHRISLGALIIALGLLVDDAIIAVEMMVVKLEQGLSRMEAASYAYTATAFPMLTGTIVTAAGFVPVGFAKSSAGEYTNAIFWVVAISLLVSWIVAVIFTPFLGYRLLPKNLAARHHDADPYERPTYRAIRAVVAWCVDWRWLVIAVTVAAFAASVMGFRFVQQQFFPAAARPELMVDLRLPEGASFAATEAAAKRLEKLLLEDRDVAYHTAYVGGGTIRFYLPLNPELRQPNFAQFVVMTTGLEARERVFDRLRRAFDQDFPELRGRVMRLENGPPVGFPVQFRVIGRDPLEIRRIAEEVRQVMAANPHTRDVNFEWNELSKQVMLEIDQDKIRALGIHPLDVAEALNTLMSGRTVTQLRYGSELVDVVARAVPQERLSLESLGDVSLRNAAGGIVPLSQIASPSFGQEEPVLWRRNRETMMNVRADIRDATQAPVVSAQIEAALAGIRATLPDGYRIDRGGAVEESEKSQASINAVMPVMVLIMVTVLMIQLQSFQRLALVVLTAPLGLIGVTAALLLFSQPFGFVAMLGVIALAGMIMRNSVILVDQIDHDIAAGQNTWEAVVGATVRRARPIFLTAAAAILAMVPLSRSVFWGPMAVAIMGGLAVATLLTLMFLPAAYAAWFRVRRPAAEGEWNSSPARLAAAE